MLRTVSVQFLSKRGIDTKFKKKWFTITYLNIIKSTRSEIFYFFKKNQPIVNLKKLAR